MKKATFLFALLSSGIIFGQCDPITTFPYNHGFETLDCWTNSSTTTPWLLGNGSTLGPGSVTEGTKAVYFNDQSYTAGSTCDLMSPLLNTATLGVPRLSFDYWDAGSDDTVKVLVFDGNTTEVVYQTAPTVNPWTKISIDLPQYAGKTIKVGFRGTSVYGYSNPHIDNLIVEKGTCKEPSGLTVSPTTAGANLSWTAGSTETDYAYVVQPAGTGTPTNSGTAVVGATSVNVTGLEPQTNYEAYIRATCGIDSSAWIGPVNFFYSGYCIPASSSSNIFINSFVTTNGASNINSTSSGYAPGGYSDQFSGSQAVSSFVGGSFNFTATTVGGTTGFAMWIDWNNDRVFDPATETVYKTSNYSNGPFTGTVSVPTGTANGDYRLRIVADLSDADPSDDACAFGSYGAAEAEDYKLTVISTPSCIYPFDLVVNEVNEDGAIISWSESPVQTGANYEYVVQAAGTGEPTGSGTAVSAAVTVNATDLTPLTNYEVYVRTACGDGNFSIWTGPVTFYYTGYCVPVSFSPYIYISSFVTSGGETNISTASGYTPGGYSDQFSGSQTVSSFAGGSFDFTATTAGGAAGFAMWIDWNKDYVFDPATETIFDTVVVSGGPFSGTVFVPTGTALGDYRLRLITDYSDSSPGDNACAFNNYSAEAEDYKITITDPPSCVYPLNVVASNLTDNSATISWSEFPSQTGVDYEYVVQAPGTGVPTASGTAVTGATSVTVSALTSQTNYEVYVRSKCGAEAFSSWRLRSFTTLCATVTTFPYTYGFETLDCWTNSSATTPWALDTGNDLGPNSVTEGTNAVFFNDYDYPSGSTSDVMSPFLNTAALAAPRLSFDYWDNSGPDTVKVVVFNGTTTEVVYETAATVSTWTKIVINLPQYAGQTIKIGFRGTSVKGATNPHIDNVVVDEGPTCIPPTGLTVSAIAATTATLSWTAGYTETNYEYVVQAPGTGVPTGSGTAVTGATTVDVSALTPQTNYEVYVRSVCGTDDVSTWAGPVSFTTLCATVTAFPYSHGFETLDCWTNSSTTTPWALDAGNYYGPNSVTEGTSALYFNDHDFETGSTSDVLSPFINTAALAAPRLSFDYWDGDGADTVKVVVFNGTTTEVVYETAAAVNAWTPIQIDLSQYAGQTIKIGFRGTSVKGATNPHIDNVVVDERPCLAPSELTITTVTQTTATLSWTAGDTETNYEYVVQAAGTGVPTGSGTAVTGATTVDVSALTPQTNYEVYVRSVCGTDDVSTWAGPVSFTTLCATVTAYPDVTAFNENPPTDCWSEADSGEIANGPSDLGSGSWRSGTAYDDGTASIPSNAINLNSNDKRDWLISPKYDISVGDLSLIVWVAVTDFNSTAADTMGSDDAVSLLMTSDNGVTWTALETWNASNQPSPTGTEFIHNLSGMSGEVQFALLGSDGTTDDSENYDFHIGYMVLSSDLSEQSVAFTHALRSYPNPVSRLLTIESQELVQDLRIFNMLNQQLVRFMPNTKKVEVDMSTYQAGVYFAKVTTAQGTQTLRVLKQ